MASTEEDITTTTAAAVEIVAENPAPMEGQQGSVTSKDETTKWATTDNREEKENKEGDPVQKLNEEALLEPDAMKVILGGAQSKAVSPSRKKDLLQQARQDRKGWVSSVPLPYKAARNPDDLWTMDPRLAAVKSSMITAKIPSATTILSNLYGMNQQLQSPEEVADRIEKLIGSWDDAATQHLTQLLNAEETSADKDVVKSYRQFCSALLPPESALLVQGIRNFIRNISEGSKTTAQIASAMKSFVQSTLESMNSHVAFKNTMDDGTRRSFESFMYAQSQPLLMTLNWDGSFAMGEEEWETKMQDLQFIKPAHLDITCLEQKESTLRDLLERPIKAVQSIESFFSPYEKLQQILAFYKGINDSLSVAMNESSTKEEEMKLPSADDVLPTMILTVIMSRPMGLIKSLCFIEAFATPESLRGEAGYAYTNLYGAVQFLNDLDMENPANLSIDASDFKEGLKACREGVETKLNVVGEVPKPTNLSTDVNIHAVRAARQRGENPDLEWAVQWQAQNPTIESQLASQSAGDSTNKKKRHQKVPEGFARSYSFLATRAEDVRLNDLPKLLREYRMLVHTAEHLLVERISDGASPRKTKQAEQKEQESVDSFENERQRSLTS